MTGVLILHVLTERPPDVLQRPKILVSRHPILSIFYFISILICNCFISIPLFPSTERSMAATLTRKRKPKPLPLARSLYLIDEEHRNVARRTRERCALLAIDSETDEDYSVDKATQTEIALREVHVEIHNWHTCLNAFCFCLLLLCMNLLYFQWLYNATKLTKV